MTTDAKAVTRWDYVEDWARYCMHEDGDYVLFTDHEQFVKELRMLWSRELVKRDEALAASRADIEELRKDAERYRWLRDPAACIADGGKGLIIEHGGICYALSDADEAIDAAMKEQTK